MQTVTSNKVKEIITDTSIVEEIELLNKLAKFRIVNLSFFMRKDKTWTGKSISADKIQIETEESNYYLYSTASPQHWYGDGALEILNNPYPDDDKEYSSEIYHKFDLTQQPGWEGIIGTKIKEIKVFSAGKKLYNLLKLRNETIYQQLTYLEFKTENGLYYSIGFHGNGGDESMGNYLNYYSWSGELIINYDHAIRKDELIKWDLRQIFKKSW